MNENGIPFLIRLGPAATGLMACLLSTSSLWGDAGYRGVATDLESGRPAYVEHHVERFEDGRLLGLGTLYRDPSGDTIAMRSLEFRVSPYLPDYRLEDFRNGSLEGARPESASVVVYCRKGRGGPLKKKRLAVPDPAVLDGGFTNFLKAHWDELGEGRTVRFNVIVPARLDYYRFAAYEDKAASRSLKGAKVMVAEPESRVLRLLAPRIEFTFDVADRRLLKYEGVSNIPKEGGGNQKVRLGFPEGGR